MSMAIGHFALGAGLTGGTLLATRLNKKVRNNERIMFGGGFWSTIPDVYHLVPSLKILHSGWWADIFWFHRLLDVRIDPGDGPLISAILFGFMAVILIIYWLVDWLAERRA